MSDSCEDYRSRAFKGGVRFRTLCEDCNKGLGAREDKELIKFVGGVRTLLSASIQLLQTVNVTMKPNLIYRGLLAHMCSANDSGVPTRFDSEARDLFFGRRSLRTSTWNLYFWIYEGADLFLMREAYFTIWLPEVVVLPMQVLKIYPVAFLFIELPWFLGLPSVRTYIQPRDDDEVEFPVHLLLRESHPVWPAVPQGMQSILFGGSSLGLVGRKG